MQLHDFVHGEINIKRVGRAIFHLNLTFKTVGAVVSCDKGGLSWHQLWCGVAFRDQINNQQPDALCMKSVFA